jgi:hypothetical protein
MLLRSMSLVYFCLLGLLKFALCPLALLLISSVVLLMFWSASLRPGAVMPWWEMPCPDILVYVVCCRIVDVVSVLEVRLDVR